MQADTFQHDSHTAEHKLTKLVIAAVWEECDAVVHVAQRFQSNAHDLVQDVWHRKEYLQNHLPDVEALLLETGQ